MRDQRVRPRIRLTITIRVAATFAVRITSSGQTAATRAGSMPRLVVGTSTRPIAARIARITNRNRAQRRYWSRPLRSPLAAAGWVEGWVVGWVAGSVVGSVTPAMLVDQALGT